MKTIYAIIILLVTGCGDSVSTPSASTDTATGTATGTQAHPDAPTVVNNINNYQNNGAAAGQNAGASAGQTAAVKKSYQPTDNIPDSPFYLLYEGYGSAAYLYTCTSDKQKVIADGDEMLHQPGEVVSIELGEVCP